MNNKEIAGIRAMLAQLPEPQSLNQLRQSYDNLGRLFPLPADVTFEQISIGNIVAEWSSTREANQQQIILYLHGGGYVIGSLNSHRLLVAELGRAAGTRTLALDYRLAPEAPYPAAVDDAIAAYQFLLDQGIPSKSIAFAGDSAGGGLCVATLCKARDLGLSQPVCALLISPWVDLELTGKSMDNKANDDPLLRREFLLQWASTYLNGNPPTTALASPLHADLNGIAPLKIQVGTSEVLLDDAIRLADRAKAEHVAVSLETWPEMIHVWHHYYPILNDARRALSNAGAFISQHMG